VPKVNDQDNFSLPAPNLDQYHIHSSAVAVEPLLDLSEETTLYSVPIAPVEMLSDIHPSVAINPPSMNVVSSELYAEPVLAAEPELYTSPSKAVAYSPTYAIPSATEVYVTQTECLNKITSSSDNAPCKCINSRLFPHRANKCSFRTFTGTNTTTSTNTPTTPGRNATERDVSTVTRTGDLVSNIDQVISTMLFAFILSPLIFLFVFCWSFAYVLFVTGKQRRGGWFSPLPVRLLPHVSAPSQQM
jgi:hypothetical protein